MTDKILIVLDLDGTLISYNTSTKDIKTPPDLDFWKEFFWYRPGAIEFIKLLQEHFEVAVWTAAGDDYANLVCRHLFEGLRPPKFIYTDKQCTKTYEKTGLFSNQSYTRKEISKVKWDVNRILVIDNTPSTYALNYENAIAITTWEEPDNRKDNELEKLGEYLVSTFSNFEGSVICVDKKR